MIIVLFNWIIFIRNNDLKFETKVLIEDSV
jgi:hypothetical protein